nr:MAG TPA: protein of unknown function (DUF5372) [Caudoviricetes sp.]
MHPCTNPAMFLPFSPFTPFSGRRIPILFCRKR